MATKDLDLIEVDRRLTELENRPTKELENIVFVRFNENGDSVVKSKFNDGTYGSEFIIKRGERGYTGVHEDQLPEPPEPIFPPENMPFGTLIEWKGDYLPDGWTVADGGTLDYKMWAHLDGIFEYESLEKPGFVEIDCNAQYNPEDNLNRNIIVYNYSYNSINSDGNLILTDNIDINISDIDSYDYFKRGFDYFSSYFEKYPDKSIGGYIANPKGIYKETYLSSRNWNGGSPDYYYLYFTKIFRFEDLNQGSLGFTMRLAPAFEHFDSNSNSYLTNFHGDLRYPMFFLFNGSGSKHLNITHTVNSSGVKTNTYFDGLSGMIKNCPYNLRIYTGIKTSFRPEPFQEEMIYTFNYDNRNNYVDDFIPYFIKIDKENAKGLYSSLKTFYNHKLPKPDSVVNEGLTWTLDFQFYDWDIYEWVTFENVKNTDFVEFDEFRSIYYFKNDRLKNFIGKPSSSRRYKMCYRFIIRSDSYHYKNEVLVGTIYEKYSELILIGNFSFGFKREEDEPVFVVDQKLRLPRALDSDGRYKLVYIGKPLKQ